MKAEDFILDHVDHNGYEDYWFLVTGEAKKELTDKYMDMCMVEVSEVVYSRREDTIGVKRLFPFNYDVIMPEDEELKKIVAVLASEESEATV